MFRKLLFLMAPEGEPPGGGTGGAPAATTTQPPATTPAGEQVTTKTGNVLPMAATTIDKIKREHMDKGRRAARTELDAKAKELGYESLDDMLKAAERNKRQAGGGNGKQQQTGKHGQGNGKQQGNQQQRANGQGNGKQGQQPNGQGGKQRQGQTDRQLREAQERIDRERRDRIRAQRQAEQAKRDAWAAEAQGELKVTALKVGVKDPDYAITLLTRECNAQRAKFADDAAYDKWLSSFSEEEFFAGLKASRPYLFEETIVPATTGTQKTNESPPPPGAGTVTKAQAAAGQKNAKDMTPEEYKADLRRRGLTPPSF